MRNKNSLDKLNKSKLGILWKEFKRSGRTCSNCGGRIKRIHHFDYILLKGDTKILAAKIFHSNPSICEKELRNGNEGQ